MGSFLKDADGMSLYLFSKDVKGTSLCSGGCAGAWPIFYAKDLISDDGLKTSDFKVIIRVDSAKQTTYKE